eukprot:TRINITY_DN6637_c0_g1_i1.p1 TRINITY_DN6637_c0_g1~~TRINITY_DN6637_c0_g1_i1.p1  ORF type:complete len:162 (-),score=42.78 TRINITY_DN6637_c0_g1_i1:67-552(-)
MNTKEESTHIETTIERPLKKPSGKTISHITQKQPKGKTPRKSVGKRIGKHPRISESGEEEEKRVVPSFSYVKKKKMMGTILRLTISQQISVLELVKEKEPELLEKGEKEYTFDLNRLRDETLQEIEGFLKQFRVSRKRPSTQLEDHRKAKKRMEEGEKSVV